MSAKKRGLGRGLDALLRVDTATTEEPDSESLRSVAIDALSPGRFQPRKTMNAQALSELAASIRTQGMIQPIVVRSVGDRRYEIIAGERRWRAAREAGLSEVPCVVREADDRATVAMALIENIQREDLAPLEEAAALQRLIEEFELTHQKAADAVGRSRAAVTNLLRLLELPPVVRQKLEAGDIEMGHARALLTLPAARAESLAERVVAQGWSVRELEAQVRPQTGSKASRTRLPVRARGVDPDVAQLERELGETLGAPVTIEAGRAGRGKLVIRYFSLGELDGLIERLRGDR